MSSNDTDSPAGRPRVYLRITGGDLPLPALIGRLNEFCDRVDEAPPRTVAVIHVDGSVAGRPGPDDTGIHTVNRWERALRRVERLDAVCIGAADGHCPGRALEILLATDLRIARRDLVLAPPTYAGQFWPGMVIHRLANQLGTVPARRLLLSHSDITAERAADLGLLDEIVDDVVASLDRLETSLGSLDGEEFALRRRLLLDAPNTSFEDALGIHLAACDRALRRSQVEVLA